MAKKDFEDTHILLEILPPLSFQVQDFVSKIGNF